MSKSNIVEPLQSLAVEVSSLAHDPANARKHSRRNLDAIKSSLARFGQRKPIVVQRAGMVVRAGNGTLVAARELGWTHVAAVVVDDTETAAAAFAIADNRSAELAEWDDGVLADVLGTLHRDGVDLAEIGFSTEELDALVAATAPDDPPLEDPGVQDAGDGVEPGSVWRLGIHTLVCGDGTQYHPGGVGALIWDPPWDAGIEPPMDRPASVLAFADGYRVGDLVRWFGAPTWLFVWDCVSSWYTPNRPLRRHKNCLWYGSVDGYDFDGAHYGDAGETREVWNTRGTYTYTPDTRGKHLSDVFVAPITKLHSEGQHSHEKPLDWLRMLVANCTSGVVFDPFAGSGAVLIACEQIGRECVSVEIDPVTCAGIIARWEQMTGRAAERVDG